MTPYPHPKKLAAWAADRALTEALFFAGRHVESPALAQERVRAVPVPPGAHPAIREYRDDLVAWLESKKQ